MTAFEHISVLISIVIGLGITHILMNVYQLIKVRERVRPYWLPIMWTCVLFVAMTEWWWAIYGLREKTDWNFFYFLFVLISPVTLFMAAAFALPEPAAEGVTDLRHFYYRNRAYFFSMLAAGPVLDAIRRGLQAGTLTDLGTWSNALSAVMVGSLAFTSNPRVHAVITIAVTALFVFFTASAALHLS